MAKITKKDKVIGIICGTLLMLLIVVSLTVYRNFKEVVEKNEMVMTLNSREYIARSTDIPGNYLFILDDGSKIYVSENTYLKYKEGDEISVIYEKNRMGNVINVKLAEEK